MCVKSCMPGVRNELDLNSKRSRLGLYIGQRTNTHIHIRTSCFAWQIVHTFENWQWQEPYLQNSLGHRARRDYPSRGEVREGGREGGRKGGGERRLRARSFMLPLARRIVSLTTRCSASFTSSAVLASSSALSLLLTHRVERVRGREEGRERKGGRRGRREGERKGEREGGGREGVRL